MCMLAFEHSCQCSSRGDLVDAELSVSSVRKGQLGGGEAIGRGSLGEGEVAGWGGQSTPTMSS